jgi:hypothetical protein
MTSFRAIDLARAAGNPREYDDRPDCCVFATELKKICRGRGIIQIDRFVRLYSDLALLCTLMGSPRVEAKCGGADGCGGFHDSLIFRSVARSRDAKLHA